MHEFIFFSISKIRVYLELSKIDSKKRLFELFMGRSEVIQLKHHKGNNVQQ